MATQKLLLPSRGGAGSVYAARQRRWRPALLVLLLLGAPAAYGADNGGLGPFPVRNLFPPTLPYLNFAPEPVLPLPESALQVTYQFAVANTFINTQYSKSTANPVIRQDQVNQGLTEANFPADGYGAYIDLEANVHTLRFRYGLTERLELGVDQAWVSFGAGGLDNSIEGVETAFNGVNQQRAHAAPNQYHYYLAKDGKLIAGTSTPFHLVPQDPVVSLKWNWGQGGRILPAVSLKLAYKSPLDRAESEPRSLVSSGRADYGYYLMFSKAVGFMVAHFQIGETLLSVRGKEVASSLKHKLFGLEFRSSESTSFLLELVTESSIFRQPTPDSARDDFQISRPSDLVLMGVRYQGKSFLFDLGFVEDTNAVFNTTDIVLFFNLGWQW
jgi:hypothetical protein